MILTKGHEEIVECRKERVEALLLGCEDDGKGPRFAFPGLCHV